jgi:hypothetical protein
MMQTIKMGLNIYLDALSALPPRKEASMSLGQEAGWTPDAVWKLWQKEKSLLSLRTETWFCSRPVRNLVTALTELPWAEKHISGIVSVCVLGMNRVQASGQCSSWEADSRPTGREIPYLLFNSKRSSPCSQQPFIRLSLIQQDPGHLFNSLYLRSRLILSIGRESSVGIATGWTAEDWGFGSRQRQVIFLYSTVSRPALGPTHLRIHWVQSALRLGLKQPVREAAHSPPSSAEVKNGGPIPSLLHTSSWGGAGTNLPFFFVSYAIYS